MNKQLKSTNKRGIEWTDFTWNPIGGCQHGCRWQMPDGTIAECYAETVAERVAQSAYPHGFEHHYWRPELLHEPLKLATPAKIFLDSMSDLMGYWIPDDQVEAILDICRRAPWHQFQLLTKNAPRLLEFEFPPNVWIGVSAPPSFMFGKRLTQSQQAKMLTRMLDVLEKVDTPVKWMSIEPLSFDIAPLLEESHLQWAVIGAATDGPKAYQPQPAWVENVLKVLDGQGTRIFFKGNLVWDEWREEFPNMEPLKNPEVAEALHL
ncbi:MAG: phage Gp37/Gp68 family protein [Anaerolineae bacterium]|nr:phage Gp37/Gp68 family protein [Anaerolineae bacterium]